MRMPQAQFKVEGSERVGALVGGELAKQFALWRSVSAFSAF